MPSMLIEGVVFLLAALLFIGAFGTMSALINRVLASLMGSAACGGVAQTGPHERAHAETVLAHFEKIRAAAIAGEWQRFHALNDQLRALDPGAWAEFNDGLHDAGIPARGAPKRGHRAD